MSQDQEKLEAHHIEERPEPGARQFRLFAGAVMVAAIVFGLLNTFNVIHM